MGKWKHRISDTCGDRVLCEHCGWVSRTTDGRGRPKCSVAKSEQQLSKEQARHRDARGVRCEVCGSTENLVTDHDHSCCSEKYGCGDCIRGTLCHKCNIELGYIERAIRRGTLDGLLGWSKGAFSG